LTQPSLTKERRQSIIEDYLRQNEKLSQIELLDEDQLAELDSSSLLIYASLCLDPRNVYTLVYRWVWDYRITMVYNHQILTKDLDDTEAQMREGLESSLGLMLKCVEEDFGKDE